MTTLKYKDWNGDEQNYVLKNTESLVQNGAKCPYDATPLIMRVYEQGKSIVCPNCDEVWNTVDKKELAELAKWKKKEAEKTIRQHIVEDSKLLRLIEFAEHPRKM